LARRSTTSPHISSREDEPRTELERLLEALPLERLEPVFTHSSWAPDRTSSYERLEFLGDSVLELAVAQALYERFSDFSEGRLAKIRSHVVSRASCAVVAHELGLGRQLAERASGIPVEELARLSENRNVLAALLEAALAALFLEHGFDGVQAAIVEAFEDRIQYAATGHVDYKTELQEALARRGQQVSYSVVDVEGPPHERRFTCAATIDGAQVGLGTGQSKKAAEQEAARQALESLGVETEAFSPS
jgi:ribonuclease-3